MDPALQELIAETPSGHEAEVVIKLHAADRVPPGVRVVARFGNIITARVAAERLGETWAHKDVSSLKAPRLVAWDPPMVGEDEAEPAESMHEDMRRRPEWPTGRGSVIGVIDWGLDFAHPDFCHSDRTTRILALWDQSAAADGNRYGYGTIHTREAINRALATSDPYKTLGYHPAQGDPLGRGSHGTHVAGIAAGSGRAPGSVAGMAPEADLIFVHLSPSRLAETADLGDSVRLLEALDFIAEVAGPRPWVTNMSLGQMSGSHDGSSLVEQAIDNLLDAAAGREVCMSTGNYRRMRTHGHGRVAPGGSAGVDWIVREADRTPNELEVWYSGRDRFDVHLVGPGETEPRVVALGETRAITMDDRLVGRMYHRAREPNNGDHHVDIFLYPKAPAGVWRCELHATEHVVDGRYHIWVERDRSRREQSYLDERDATESYTTGTICNGYNTLSVGAVDASGAPAWFSSAGPTRDGRQKPDLVAPGVAILSSRSRPGAIAATESFPMVCRMSGTSMATPHVTGAVALLLEAAGRPLKVGEIRSMMLGSTRAATPEVEGDEWALGNGYLDVDAALARSTGAAQPVLPDHETDTETAQDMTVAKPVIETQQSEEFMPTEPFDTRSEPDSAHLDSEFSDNNLIDSEFTDIYITDSALIDNKFIDSELIDNDFVDRAFTESTDSAFHGSESIDSEFPDGEPREFDLPKLALHEIEQVLPALVPVLASADPEAVAAASQGRMQLLARSGMPIPDTLSAGDILVRMARGEQRSPYVAVLEDGRLHSRAEAVQAGMAVEGVREGGYARVIEQSMGQAWQGQIPVRRIADAHGHLGRGQWLLRPVHANESISGPNREFIAEELPDELNAWLRAASRGMSALVQIASGAGAAQAVQQTMGRQVQAWVARLYSAGAASLAGETDAMLRGGTAIVIGLLRGTRDPAALAQRLLDGARQANQRQASSPWTRAFLSHASPIGHGTAVLGGALTTMLSRLDVQNFYDDLVRGGTSGDLLRPLVWLPRGSRSLNPRHLPIPFDLEVPWEQVHRLLVEFIRYARGSAQAEDTLMRIAGEMPWLAPFLLGAGAVEAVLTRRSPWMRYINKDLSNPRHCRDLGVRVKELPAPGAVQTITSQGQQHRYTVKYLILSDCHRGAAADRQFHGGSIDHFGANQALYMRVLDWAIGRPSDTERHIVIENGDVEDLWAIPDLGQDRATRLREVLQSNAAIYRKLKELHAQGRYYRTLGNHDSYLRDARMFNIVKQWEGGWPGPDNHELVNWDFLLIPGVKTMDEFSLLDLLSGLRSDDPNHRFSVFNFLGLDPDLYTAKKCLVVCHGHQFDFWNAPENELLGKIVTAFVRYPDAWMDPFMELGGIHMQGNPWFDFSDFFAHERNLLFNNWPPRQASVASAHRIQHMANRERQMVDDFMYQETLAAALVNLLMPLGQCGGRTHTSLSDKLGHQLLIGHTHYPQSQPFYPLGRVLRQNPATRPLFNALGGLISALLGPTSIMSERLSDIGGPEMLESWLDSTVKSRFFNSGMAGIQEAVIYAIEITTQGQARLLYWTDRHDQPQEMDWELAPLSPQARAAMNTRRGEAQVMARRFHGIFQGRRAALNEAFTDYERAPGGSFDQALGIFRNGVNSMVEAVTRGAGDALDSVLPDVARLQVTGAHGRDAMHLRMVEFLTEIGRMVSAPGGPRRAETAEPAAPARALPSFEFRVPLSARQATTLQQIGAQLGAAGLATAQPQTAGSELHMGLVWLFAYQHAPYFGGAQTGVSTCPPALPVLRMNQAARNLSSVGALLAWMPSYAPIVNLPAGRHLALQTQIQLEPGEGEGRMLHVDIRVVQDQATPTRQAPQPAQPLVS